MDIAIELNSDDPALIKRRKLSVQKKYSPTHSKSIEEANHLSVYLYALGKEAEAMGLLASYCGCSPYVPPRYERWEAVCFAMLFLAHLKYINGEAKEFQRLISIVKNDNFNPNHWFSENDFDEFIGSANKGIDDLEDVTKTSKAQVRAEGYLALLVALYLWTEEWPSFKCREKEIINQMGDELLKLKALIS